MDVGLLAGAWRKKRCVIGHLASGGRSKCNVKCLRSKLRLMLHFLGIGNRKTQLHMRNVIHFYHQLNVGYICQYHDQHTLLARRPLLVTILLRRIGQLQMNSSRKRESGLHESCR